jgi:hypothetical protein
MEMDHEQHMAATLETGHPVEGLHDTIQTGCQSETAEGLLAVHEQGGSRHLPRAAPSTVYVDAPMGGNLVSAVRSFLPLRRPASPPAAAGKKPVKVSMLIRLIS